MAAYCEIIVNGRKINVLAERKLLDILREELALTSVKNGCAEGACGACTVLIDGRPVKACVQKAVRFAGKSILTVEGLTPREKEVYAAAFAEAGAVQCGFCTPGMVLAGKSLLDRNLEPSRLEAAAAIRNNICRCTGYRKIIDGILLAAEYLREDRQLPEKPEHAGIGSALWRIDAADKVLGQGEYCDDIRLPDMAAASVVRSAYPRARVLHIDTEAAAKVPGVIAVLTAKDVPGNNKVGHLKKDWDAFIAEGDCTRFLGDAIALVVAENENALAGAKELVHVDYEELTPLCTPEEALASGAPKLHEDGNILDHEHLVRGDAVGAIARSAHKVTRIYRTPWTEHAFLEPECAVAMPFEDGVYIYSSDQGTYDTRRETAGLLGLPLEKVVVENKLVGGAFGGKEDVTVQHYAALAAYLTGRIVKCRLTRAESILVHPKRHAMEIKLTTACDEKGFLTGMQAVIVTDNGAYASLGGPVLQRACTHAAGPYNYQDIDIDGMAVYTDNPPAGAFRGFGVTQTCFATECNINLLAELCGIDPWQFRWQNAIRPGQTLPNGQIADASTGLVETLEAVKDDFYAEPYAGIACAMKNAGVGVGIPDVGRVRLLVANGRIHIHAGASCIGQGVGTVLVQMVAEITGAAPSEIVWHAPNTRIAPDAGTTSGSRQTLLTGEAACIAARKLQEKRGGLALAALDGQEFYGEYGPKTDPMGTPVPHPVSHVAYGYATQLCLLNEDGTIKKIIAAHDVGRAVNPVSVEGQIEGGVVMSCGYALTEHFPLKNGRPLAKFGTLGLFRADRAPEVEARIIEKAGIEGAGGAIGIGEITSIPTAPAIAGAYYKLTGEFETELPLRHTPYDRRT